MNVASGLQPLRAASAVDASNPTGIVGPDSSKAVDGFGVSTVVFGISLTATGATSVTIQPIHFDPVSNKWLANPDQAKTYNAAGDYLLPVESYGTHVWPKVTAISGTNAKVEISHGKVRKRMI